MLIRGIRLKNFRNYETLDFRPNNDVNMFFGQNGAGKTNILEAIHYCTLGRSHRTSLDREVVRRNEKAASATVLLDKRGERIDVTIQLMPDEAKKKIVYINGKRVQRMADLMGQIQCVIFSPEDLQLIKGGPAIRRRYLDMLLSQLSPAYFIALQQYQKAMEQRNAILRADKRGEYYDRNMLDAFEAAMAEPCGIIIPFRRKIMRDLGEYANHKYTGISGRENEPFTMTYECCAPDANDIPAYVRQRLKESRQADVARGTTGFGIHREDLSLQLCQRDMKLYASQGQIRTAALSLKLAQIDLLIQYTNDPPILLLDDVMSELDMTRRMRLLVELTGVQTFITCTDSTDLEECFEDCSFVVQTDKNNNAYIERIKEPEIEESINRDEYLGFLT